MGQRGRTLLASLVLVLCACGSGGSVATQKGVITIGHIVSSSGVYGFTGVAHTIENEVASNEINGAGGVTIGNTNYTLKFITLDDRSDPQTAVADAVQLFRDDHVKILFGPIANQAVSVAPIAAQQSVLNFTEASAANNLLNDRTNYPLLFGILTSAQYRGRGFATTVHQLFPSAKKVAWMGPNDSVAQSYQTGMTPSLLSGFGITLQNFLYPPGTTDLSTIATRVKAFQPDAVMVEPPDQEAINVLNSLSAAGVPNSVPAIVSDGSPTNIVAHSGGRHLVLFEVTPIISATGGTPGEQKWYSAMTAQATKDGVTLSASQIALFPGYYNVVRLLLAAMQKANSTTDTKAIAKALPNVSAAGVAGTVTFNGGFSLVMNMAAINYPTGDPNNSATVPVNL